MAKRRMARPLSEAAATERQVPPPAMRAVQPRIVALWSMNSFAGKQVEPSRTRSRNARGDQLTAALPASPPGVLICRQHVSGCL